MTATSVSTVGVLRTAAARIVAAGAVVAAAWALLGAVGGATLSLAGEATDSFTFRFAPPPDTRYVQTYLMTRERSIEGLPEQLDTAESKTNVEIRKTDEDYDVITKPVMTVMKKDHELIDDPVSTILSELEPSYRIGADGQIKDVRGFGGVAERLAAVLPPGVAKALASLISEAAMVEREKAEWRARYGELAGRTFRIGDSVDARLPYRMPNGEVVDYSLRTYFTRWEPCPAGQCVRVDISYQSDELTPSPAVGDAQAPASAASSASAAPAVPSASAASSGEATAAAAPASAASAPNAPLRRVSGSTSRLIDPQTMRLYAEQQNKTITMNLDVPERGKVPAVFRELSRYEFVYE